MDLKKQLERNDRQRKQLTLSLVDYITRDDYHNAKILHNGVAIFQNQRLRILRDMWVKRGYISKI